MKRVFRIFLVLLLALVLAGFSYRFLHRRALRARLTALYEQSLLPPRSAGDLFNPEAMLEHCDSLLQSAHDSPTLLRATQYKAGALIKEGEEARDPSPARSSPGHPLRHSPG